MATVEKQVEDFMQLSRAERKEKYAKLSPEVKKKARVASEKRRGIAFRTQDGDIILTRDALKAQILRIEEKLNDMPRRMKVLEERLVELTKQAEEVYGEHFFSDLDTKQK